MSILQRRQQNKSVTGKAVRQQARKMLIEIYPNSPTTFKASKGWFQRFRSRNSVCYRRTTSVGQKVPEDAPERCDAFLEEMQNMRDFDLYINMDETPAYFDIPRQSTFNFEGVQTVKIKITGHEKLRFTVVLLIGIRRNGSSYEAFRLPVMFRCISDIRCMRLYADKNTCTLHVSTYRRMHLYPDRGACAYKRALT